MIGRYGCVGRSRGSHGRGPGRPRARPAPWADSASATCEALRGGGGAGGRSAPALAAAGLVRPFRGIRYCGYTPTLYSLACDGPEFIYRVKDSSAVSHSAIGDRHARVFTRWKRLVNRALVSYLDRLCSPLLPAARPGPAARSPAPCRRALYHLPQPMLMSISICASGVEASSPCRCCSSSPCRCRPPRT